MPSIAHRSGPREGNGFAGSTFFVPLDRARPSDTEGIVAAAIPGKQSTILAR